MSCTSPQCYLIPREGGRPKKLMVDWPAGLHPLGRVVYLPCGGCLSCRRERRQELTLLQCCEASLHEDNWFITLTYEDWKTIQLEGIPPYSLDKGHLSAFCESMRKYCAYNGVSFRFFACGEYGDKYERPHYHLSVFGLSPEILGINNSSDDKETRRKVLNDGKLCKLRSPLRDENGNEYWCSRVLDLRWPFGSHKIYRATRETFQYVAGYVTKKLTGQGATVYRETHRLPPFQAQSRPSIGWSWFDRFYQTLSIPDRDKLVNDVVSIYDVSWKCPRIFDKWLQRYDHFDGKMVSQIAKDIRSASFPDIPDREDLKRKRDFAAYQAAYYKQNNKHKEVK